MKRTWKCLAALLLACCLTVELPASVSAAAPGPDQTTEQTVDGVLPGDPDQTPTGGEQSGDGQPSATLSSFAGSDEELADLATAQVVVDLFQVASLTMNADRSKCTYTLNDPYANTALAGELEYIVNNPDVEEGQKLLQKMAVDAALKTVTKNEDGKLVYADTVTCYREGAPTQTRNPGIPADDITEIQPGLYLVFARGVRDDVGEHPFLYQEDGEIVTRVRTQEYVYTYRPLLIFVPGTDENGDWNYDVDMHLKPTRSAGRVGDLEIVKTVRNYVADHDGAFVFRVDVYIDGQLDPRFGGIQTLTFNQEGSQTITLTGIPEDAEVVVTELYSGAAYRLDPSTPATQRGLISFDEVLRFEFVNVGSTGGGGAVRNHFSFADGAWAWTPIPIHE